MIFYVFRDFSKQDLEVDMSKIFLRDCDFKDSYIALLALICHVQAICAY